MRAQSGFFDLYYAPRAARRRGRRERISSRKPGTLRPKRLCAQVKVRRDTPRPYKLGRLRLFLTPGRGSTQPGEALPAALDHMLYTNIASFLRHDDVYTPIAHALYVANPAHVPLCGPLTALAPGMRLECSPRPTVRTPYVFCIPQLCRKNTTLGRSHRVSRVLLS